MEGMGDDGRPDNMGGLANNQQQQDSMRISWDVKSSTIVIYVGYSIGMTHQ